MAGGLALFPQLVARGAPEDEPTGFQALAEGGFVGVGHSVTMICRSGEVLFLMTVEP